MIEEVPFRARGFEIRHRRWAGAVTLLCLLALWQAGAAWHWFSTDFLSTPAAILAALGHLAASGGLWRDVSASLLRLLGGWSAGTLAGLAAGLAIGLSGAVRAPGMAVISALFPIPKIALVPLFIIWFGIGEGSKLVTVGFGVFFPMVISTVAAIDAVPRNLIRMGQSFGLSPAAVVWRIVLPGALPALLAAMRITAATAIILLVAAEMIGAENGIGAFVLRAGNLYDIEALMAGIAVLSLLGLAAAGLIGLAERLLLRWR